MVRYPRGLGIGVALDADLVTVPHGRGEILSEGKDLFFLAYGSMVPVASEAAAILAARGISCGVANARFAKPLDTDLLARILAIAPRVVTVEEHLAAGGFGSAVLEECHARGLDASGVKVHAIPDQFVEHSPQALQRRNFRLDAEGLVARAFEFFPDLGAAGGVSVSPDVPAGEKKASEKLVETVSW